MTEEEVQVYPYGFQPRASFHQSAKSSDIISIAYSPFSGDFALLDGAGITHWNKDTQIDYRLMGQRGRLKKFYIGRYYNSVTYRRLLTYPSNKKQLLKQIIFIPKYGIYFALAKDNTLQLLNAMLQCSFVFDADNGTILCMLYDMRRDIIITAGVGGVKMWRYLHHKCDRDQAGTEQFFIPHRNYSVLPSQWITRVQLDESNDRLLCVAQKEIIILSSDCDFLFTINTSPSLPLTDCCYCAKFKYYITASIDTAMKVWSEQGTMLHTFTAHSKAVTSVLMHPQSEIIMISASIDKSVRLWNLETFEEIYKLQVCEHGIQWVGLTRDNYLYCGTSRDLTVWSINFLAHFFSQTRVPVSRISPVMHCNSKKTPRVVVVGEDSSVRLLSALSGQSVSTILPPPHISPLNKILDVSYSRYYGLIFLLIDSLTIWVYTSRTDPSSRVDTWDEDVLKLMLQSTDDVSGTLGVSCSIQCLTVLHNHVTVEGEEGPVTPTCVNLLVLALLDGRLVFIDPVVKGLKYHTISVHKDPIYAVSEYEDRLLVTTLSHVTTLTFLSLPHLNCLGKVCVGPAGTMFTVLENHIVSSFSSNVRESGVFNVRDSGVLSQLRDSGVSCHSLLQAHTLIFSADGTIESKVVAEKRQDVQSSYNIHTLDGCPAQNIVASCGNDGIVRIFTHLLVPTREVILNSTLTTVSFLNKSGDILLGFLGNIYKISSKFVTDEDSDRKTSVSSYLTESTVFEDPAIKYDNMGEVAPTTIENYLMPFKGKYNTDWQGLCVTDLEEPELDSKNSGESERGDSLAPTDIVMSPSECSVSRSVVNISLTDLNESVYLQHYDIGLVKEVQDAWQMPKCGTSPRTTPPPVEVTTIPTDPPPAPPSQDVIFKPFPQQKRRPAYQLPIQRSCTREKKIDRVPVENVLSDLSLTSISDEEKDSVKEKGEKRKNVPLWKPNGPNSTPAMDIQKVIKKKKLDRKRSKKRVMLVKRASHDGKFSDKFSDITKTTDDSASMMSDEVSDVAPYSRQQSDRSGKEDKSLDGTSQQKLGGTLDPETGDSETAASTGPTVMDTADESGQSSKYLERSVLDTVTEGVTEGIIDVVEKVQWDVKDKIKRSKSKKKLKGTQRSANSAKSSTGGLSSRSHTLSHVPSNSLRRQRSRVASAPQQRPRSAGLQEGTTVAMVTERLTLSKSLLSRKMEKRPSATTRVHSAPEVRALTPPTLHRSKQGCPLTFNDLVRADEKGGFESKWVLHCIESDVFNKTNRPKKRITSAPPRFHHPPGSLRPAYMDKPPKPAVEPAYDEDWHEKIVEQHENRRRVAEQRHLEAAERRRLLNCQQQKKAALIREKCNRAKKTKTNGYLPSDRYTPSPPPGPLPTAISLHSSLNYRVKSAMSFTAPNTSPSPALSHSSSSSHMEGDPASPVLAKAALLRNASEQFLCYSAATTASVG